MTESERELCAEYDQHMECFMATEPRMTRDDSWREDAACAGVDPSVFFRQSPRYGGGIHYITLHVMARRICAECPVRPECLGEALTVGDHGIRGGLTTFQRRALKTKWWFIRCLGCGLTTRKAKLGKGGAAQRLCGPCKVERRQDQLAESARTHRDKYPYAPSAMGGHAS